MNSLVQLSCQYLTPNKTIETIEVSDGINEKTLFIYNYKGVSFRIFSSQKKLSDYWKGEAVEEQNFATELELNAYLATFKL